MIKPLASFFKKGKSADAGKKDTSKKDADLGEDSDDEDDSDDDGEEDDSDEEQEDEQDDETGEDDAEDEAEDEPKKKAAATGKMVSISASKLAGLKRDAKLWQENKAQFATLSDWYATAKKAGTTKRKEDESGRDPKAENDYSKQPWNQKAIEKAKKAR